MNKGPLEQQDWYQRLKEPVCPIFLEDFYKSDHVSQYQKGITKIYSNYTPRYGRDGSKGMNWFGMQYFLKEYLFYQYHESFFKVPWSQLEKQIKEFYKETLGTEPKTEHLKKLHEYGRMPLDIYSIPEGRFLEYGVPGCVLVNTQDWAFWLPNKLETLLSCSIWGASTSATTASYYHQIFTRWAKIHGETDFSFVDFMGHDFSMRGMWGVEGATLSALGHLTSFSGTDTEPAIHAAKKYYNAKGFVGGSVPATEHSVMCAGGLDGELETFERLCFETYPSGVLSIVSDTWDLWKVLTEFVPKLKERILKRPGKIVIRPDTGDPVKIMTGDPNSTFGPERAGVLRLLADTMGVDGGGHIYGMGAIYGDSITLERANKIHENSVMDLKLSPYNTVLGIGSYTYTYVTRDNHGQAMKATAVVKDGVLTAIFKDPITDQAGSSKKSHVGIPTVYEHEGKWAVRQNSLPAQLDSCAFRKVVEDGYLVWEDDLGSIRKRVREDGERKVA